VPINVEARGQLRIWKRTAEAQRLRFERSLRGDPHLAKTVVDFAMKRGDGQRRAFGKLQKAFAGATLEYLRYDKPPVAIWAYLNPRHTTVVDPQTPSDAQDCVTVDYIVVGSMPTVIGTADGLWTLEVTEHALGRVLQRSPNTDISAMLLGGHHAVL